MHPTSFQQAPARRDAWSDYWASGRLHSCATSFQGNYAGAIGGFWRAALSSLPAHSRVLDLATGNGAVPALLWELHRGAVDVDAVDMAHVAPTWLAAEHGASIRFHPGVDMEALPFADGSFDCVTSQFGFEYARRQPALAEACRVLADGGGLHLVLHHQRSRLVQVGREEISHHQHLAAPEGLLAAAHEVLPVLAAVRAGRPPDSAAVQARERYNRALAELAAIAGRSSAPDLLLETRQAVHGLLAGVGPDPAPVLKGLARLEQDLARARLRTAEMVECALDRAQVDELAHALGQARPGWRVEVAELAQAEGVLGWSLSAAPPARG